MEGEGIVSMCSVRTENFLSSGIKTTSAISGFFNQSLILQILPLKEHISILFSLLYFYPRKKESEEIYNKRDTLWTSIASV